MSKSWVKIVAESEICDTIHPFQAGKKRIAVARLEGHLYAFDGLCPHVAGPMHRAEVQGTIVTCPFHAWRFDLRQNGREIHDYRPLETYALRVEGGDVYVELDQAGPVTAVARLACRAGHRAD